MASERLNIKVVVNQTMPWLSIWYTPLMLASANMEDYTEIFSLPFASEQPLDCSFLKISRNRAHDIAKLASSHGVGNIWFHPIRPIIPALACNDIVNPVLI